MVVESFRVRQKKVPMAVWYIKEFQLSVLTEGTSSYRTSFKLFVSLFPCLQRSLVTLSSLERHHCFHGERLIIVLFKRAPIL